MSRQFRRGARVALAFLLVVSGFLLPALGTPRAHADPAPEPGSAQFNEAFAQITQCVAVNGTLLVSLLVDHTGTLRTMDPELDRQGAVIEVIDALAELSGQPSADGQPVSVEASMALFGDHYREISGWGDVAGAHGDQLRQAAVDQINNENLDNQTDFGSALAGAQASITARAVELPGQACSIIFWFTDGRLDVGPGDLAATEAVRTDICRADGIADSIRESGTHLIAMALFTEVADDPNVPESHRVSAADRDWLQAVAEATGPGGASCGTPSATSGGYLMANDGHQLARQFAGVGAMIQGFNPGGVNLSNVSGPISFPVDAGVGRVRLAFTVAEPGSVPVLLPDGSSIDLTTSAQLAEGLSVEARGSGSSYVATIASPTGLPEGIWTIAAAAEGTATVVTDIYYFWDVELAIAAPNGVMLREVNPIIVSRTRHGVVDSPASYASSSITATINGVEISPAAITDNGDGTFSFDIDLTDGTSPTSAQVVVSARAATAGHGIELGPVAASQFFPVALPVGFPTIAGDARVDFGTFSQATPAHRRLGLVGSDQGPTVVCFGESAFTAAPANSNLSLALPSGPGNNCIDLAQNETREVELVLSAAEPGEGRIDGHIPVTLHSVRGDEPQTLDLPIAASMFRPVDAAVRNAILFAAIAAALALAWLIAAIGRARSDRFSTGDDFRVASIPVLLTANGLTRPDRRGNLGPFFDSRDFNQQPKVAPAPRADVSGLNFQRRGNPVWPWAPYRASVTAASGPVAAIPVNNPVVVIDNGTGTATDFAFPTRMYLVGAQKVAAAETSATLVAFAEGTGGSISDRVDEFNDTLGRVGDWSAVGNALGDSPPASPAVAAAGGPAIAAAGDPSEPAGPSEPVGPVDAVGLVAPLPPGETALPVTDPADEPGERAAPDFLWGGSSSPNLPRPDQDAAAPSPQPTPTPPDDLPSYF